MPEGLSRFYLDDPRKRHGPDAPIGASWMTREDREHEIRQQDERLREREQALGATQHTLIAKEQQLEERQRRFEQRERELEEREQALRGGDGRWWGSDPASSH